jgi:hypothetical protein
MSSKISKLDGTSRKKTNDISNTVRHLVAAERKLEGEILSVNKGMKKVTTIVTNAYGMCP